MSSDSESDAVLDPSLLVQSRKLSQPTRAQKTQAQSRAKRTNPIICTDLDSSAHSLKDIVETSKSFSRPAPESEESECQKRCRRRGVILYTSAEGQALLPFNKALFELIVIETKIPKPTRWLPSDYSSSEFEPSNGGMKSLNQWRTN